MEPDLEGVDCREDRSGLLPANPYEWQGTRHPLARPLMHGSRLARRRLLGRLAERKARW